MKPLVFLFCFLVIFPAPNEGQLIDFFQRVFGGLGGGRGLAGLGNQSPIFSGGFRLGGGGLPLIGLVSARLFNPLGGAFYRPLSGFGFGPLSGVRGGIGQRPGIGFRGNVAGIPFALRGIGFPQQVGIGQAIPYPGDKAVKAVKTVKTLEKGKLR